jgi:hypothetical protein
MVILRHIVIGLVLICLLVLAVLSIVGAVEGADRARLLFNSVPVAAYWAVFVLLAAVGFVIFPRLVTSPPALLMHLAPLFILAGAMWGSDAAHQVRRQIGDYLRPWAERALNPAKAAQVLGDWLGCDKVPSAYMVLYEGQEDSRLIDKTSNEVIAELPFALRLRKFSIDYYPPRGQEWNLSVVLPVFDAGGQLVDEQWKSIRWEPGREMPVPGTAIRLRVLQYLPSAAPVFEKGAKPYVEITPREGRAVTLPAEVGREVAIKEPPLTIRVMRVFENLVVRGAGAERQVTDAPGEGANAAVQVEVVQPDGTARSRYLMALVPMHGQTDDGVSMRYVLPRPTGARPDPSTGAAAMEVELSVQGHAHRAWLLPQKEEKYAVLSLEPLASPGGVPAEAGQGLPALYLAAPRGDVRAYNSDVEVLQDYRRVAHKVIQVNHPLHYGGYHFYQYDYDKRDGRYTVLLVVSDSGLWAVWAGFVLLVGGACWKLWLVPVWNRGRA